VLSVYGLISKPQRLVTYSSQDDTIRHKLASDMTMHNANVIIYVCYACLFSLMHRLDMSAYKHIAYCLLHSVANAIT
jgi:hypothetical protein